MDKIFQQGCSVRKIYQELWCDSCSMFMFICLNNSLQGHVKLRCPNCSTETKKRLKNGLLCCVEGAIFTKDIIVPMKAACSPEKKLKLSTSDGYAVVADVAESFVESDKWAFLFGDFTYGVARYENIGS